MTEEQKERLEMMEASINQLLEDFYWLKEELEEATKERGEQKERLKMMEASINQLFLR